MGLYDQSAIVSEPRAVYVLWDRRAEGPVLSTTWFASVDPPYIRGTGVRLRVGRFAITIGVCKRTRPFSRPVPIITEKFGGWDEEDPTAPQDEPARSDGDSSGHPFALPA